MLTYDFLGSFWCNAVHWAQWQVSITGRIRWRRHFKGIPTLLPTRALERDDRWRDDELQKQPERNRFPHDHSTEELDVSNQSSPHNDTLHNLNANWGEVYGGRIAEEHVCMNENPREVCAIVTTVRTGFHDASGGVCSDKSQVQTIWKKPIGIWKPLHSEEKFSSAWANTVVQSDPVITPSNITRFSKQIFTNSITMTRIEPGGCFTNVLRTVQNNIAKIHNAGNHIDSENFKLNLCTSTKFQLEILIRSTISAINKFRENILESSWNVSETPPDFKLTKYTQKLTCAL